MIGQTTSCSVLIKNMTCFFEHHNHSKLHHKVFFPISWTNPIYEPQFFFRPFWAYLNPLPHGLASWFQPFPRVQINPFAGFQIDPSLSFPFVSFLFLSFSSFFFLSLSFFPFLSFSLAFPFQVFFDPAYFFGTFWCGSKEALRSNKSEANRSGK